MSTVRSTAPGQRANRRACSAGAAQVREAAPPGASRRSRRANGAARTAASAVRERALRGRGVVHVVRGDHVDAGRHRDLGQRVVAVPVERVTVVPQLDEHPVASEAGDEPVERARAPRRGPSRTSAAGTVPLRHPVSTNQLSLRALGCGWRCTGARGAASASSVVRGAPFSPASAPR